LTPASAYAFETRALCHTASYAVVKTAHGGMFVDPDAEDSVVIRCVVINAPGSAFPVA
jgi:hypothetical protein